MLPKVRLQYSANLGKLNFISHENSGRINLLNVLKPFKDGREVWQKSDTQNPQSQHYDLNLILITSDVEEVTTLHWLFVGT